MELMLKTSSKLLARVLQKSAKANQSSVRQFRTSYCRQVMSEHRWTQCTQIQCSLTKTLPLLKRHMTITAFPIPNHHAMREYSTSWMNAAVPSDTHSPGPELLKTAAQIGAKTSLSKKKGPKKMPEDGYEAVAYGTSEHINLSELKNELQARQVYEVLTDLPKDLTDVLIVEAKYAIDNEKREIFFFRKGAIVFWNVPEIERVSILRAVKKFQKFPWDGDENETLTYMYTETPTCVITDHDPIVDVHIQMSTLNAEQLLQKYAISNSLLATVKLAIYENQLEKRMDYFWAILLDLKQGKLRLTRDQTLKQIGEQSMLRYYINMRSDLLDPPDFYWDRDALEELYFQILDTYNIDKRTEVMNKKLDSSLHLIEILRDHLTNAHSSQLEILIILLIALEVLFSLDHYNLGPEAWVNGVKRYLNIGGGGGEEEEEVLDVDGAPGMSEIPDDGNSFGVATAY